MPLAIFWNSRETNPEAALFNQRPRRGALKVCPTISPRSSPGDQSREEIIPIGWALKATTSRNAKDFFEHCEYRVLRQPL